MAAGLTLDVGLHFVAHLSAILNESDIMDESAKTLVGTVTGVSDRRITGWLRADRSDAARPLALIVDGKKTDFEAVFSDEEIPDDIEYPIVNFFFEAQTSLAISRLFKVSVRTNEGVDLAPGPMMVNQSDVPSGKHLSLGAMDLAINAVIESQTTAEDLQNSVSLIASWFGHAVDRLNAINEIGGRRADTLTSLLRDQSMLGGAFRHLIGVVVGRYTTLVVPRCIHPEVSIVIPVHNNFDITYNCIKSLVELTKSVRYEIIVVDDCSSDETMLSKLIFEGSLTVLRTERNLGFVGACNSGAAIAKGKYLLFLNNDTLIRDEFWLKEMIDTFSRFDRVGIVGARLVFADDVLQECGGIVWKDASAWNCGRYGSTEDWRYRYAREVDYVSGACLMIEKEAFDNIGHFDLSFAPAYYEDTDLCFRIRAAGRRVFVQPSATIVHLEGKSNGTNVSAGLKRYQVRNQTTFASRWASVLQNHQVNGFDVDKAMSRYDEKLALFIDDSMLTPSRDAGSNAAIEHIRSLQRLGFKVIFVPADNMADIKPYSLQMESLGIECIYAPNFWSLEDFLRRDQREFNLIYIHRFSNADRYLHLCRRLRKTSRIVYNVADLHSLRESRAAELAEREEVYGASSLVSQAREFAMIKEADATIVHSSAERDHLAEQGIHQNIHVVPWTIPLHSPVACFGDTQDIAFIGGFRHSPNVDAVLWFFKNVLHQLLAMEDSLRFIIIGSDMPDEFRHIDHPRVQAIGYVENLTETLPKLRVTVAPLRFGAGLKGKVLTSMAFGVPCVMSTIAAEGIPLPLSIRDLVSDDPATFARTIFKLYSDESWWARASNAGLTMISNEFSKDSIDKKMKEVVQR